MKIFLKIKIRMTTSYQLGNIIKSHSIEPKPARSTPLHHLPSDLWQDLSVWVPLLNQPHSVFWFRLLPPFYLSNASHLSNSLLIPSQRHSTRLLYFLARRCTVIVSRP